MYLVLINKPVGFSQSCLRFATSADIIQKTKYQPSTDILRISPKHGSCDMPEYHNIFMASKTLDKLEISVILEEQIYCNSIVVINNGAITKTKTY